MSGGVPGGCREDACELLRRGDELGRSLDGLGGRPLRPLFERGDLSLESPPASVELEQHGLGGLAGVPELSPGRVVRVSLPRDRQLLRVEQLLLLDDRRLGQSPSDDDAEVAETGGPRSLQQRQAGARVLSLDRCSSPGESGGHGALVADRNL